MMISNFKHVASSGYWSDFTHYANSSVSRWSGLILATSAAALVGLGLYRWSYSSSTNVQENDISKANNGSAIDQKETFNQVKDRVKRTYGYVFGGFVLTAAAAAAAHISGLSLRILISPYAGIALCLTSCGALIATQLIDKKNSKAQLMAWGIFNASMGMALSPLGYIDPRIVAQAAAVSLGLGGALTLTAFLAPDKSFLAWEGPLIAALTCISAASTVAIFFPASAFAYGVDRVSLYGGLIIFSALLMASTQGLMEKAEKQSDNEFDPLKSSINIYLDGMNIFLRVLRWMLENNEKQKLV